MLAAAAGILTNFSLIVAFVCAAHTFRPWQVRDRGSTKQQAADGLLLGLLSGLVMLFAVRPVPGVMADLRSIPIVAAAMLGGPVAAFTAAAAALTARLLIGGAPAAQLNAGVGIIAFAAVSSLMAPWSRRGRVQMLVTGVILGLMTQALLYLMPQSGAEAVRQAGLPVLVFSIGGLLLLWELLAYPQYNFYFARLVRSREVTDPLTGLHNARFLQERLTEYGHQPATRVGVLFLDLDGFEALNASHGQQAADRVLKQVAEYLKGEIGRHGYVIRYGGDEFVLLIPNVDPALALEFGEHLRSQVSTRTFGAGEGGTEVRLTLSVGVAFMPDHGRTPQEILRRADEALFQAKKAGRDRVRAVGAEPRYRRAEPLPPT